MPGKVRPLRIPASTYRVQLNHRFTFANLEKIVDYLNLLGITDVYLSPIVKAKSGSIHCYDITNPEVLNPELGTDDGFERVVKNLKQYHMGVLVDVVPNHMCISDSTNAWWNDVLENGPSSPFAQFFDIDWNPPRENLINRVLLPVLGLQYGKALEEQKIKISYSAGSFVICLEWGATLPVNPRTWPLILQPALQQTKERLGEESTEVMELESILTALHYLPARTETDVERVRERQREKEIIKRRLSDLETKSSAVKGSIEKAVEQINGRPGDPSSFNALDELLDNQAYRLSFWRVASEEINYRRFFDINDLAAIRVEDEEVFDEVHKKILDLVRNGSITGLRVDHADGLFDPVRYFGDLQQACLSACGISSEDAKSFYVVAEKILTGDERLPPDWHIRGTTGYEYLNLVNGVFVSRPSRKILRSFFARLTGSAAYDFEGVVYQAKKLILSSSMSSELHVLSRRLDRICQKQRHSRDFTLEHLRFALGEVIACFPVYRTYTRMDQTEVKPEDVRHTVSAIRMAKARNPAFSEDVFDFISSILLLQEPASLTGEEKAEHRMFLMRFQQLTGPVMAKGLEDTAFYRSFPLASLNEVGGGPESFGVSLRHFHDLNRERQINFPFSLLASSTHDTKWGEDARARLNVLSEIPLRWIRAVRRWQALNRHLKVVVDGVRTPDEPEEYRLYQALVGAWPIEAFSADRHEEFVRRINEYMHKASKEAKLHTSWIQPNTTYEEALTTFVNRVLDSSSQNQFLKEFKEFHQEIARAGVLNSLAQTLLKMVSPGLPDFYQGTERWNLSLVDPDNRRPVDFAKSEELLGQIDNCPDEEAAPFVKELLRVPEDGRIKLWLVSRVLRFRRENPELFSFGSYMPLRASGAQRSHVVAFARRVGEQVAIAAAGRFFKKLGMPENGSSAWEGSKLILPRGFPAAVYRDVLTNEHVQAETKQGRMVLPLRSIFSTLPTALLIKN